MFKEEEIKEIINKIKDFSDPEKILLFGSYAKRNPSDASDIDILIIKLSDEPFHKRARKIRAIFRESGIPLDILVYTPEEIERLKNIKGNMVNETLKSGVVVYEKR
ncbi:MAG: nucleotidyltransferase domain-containing protein [Nitrospirota bacterium]